MLNKKSYRRQNELKLIVERIDEQNRRIGKGISHGFLSNPGMKLMLGFIFPHSRSIAFITSIELFNTVLVTLKTLALLVLVQVFANGQDAEVPRVVLFNLSISLPLMDMFDTQRGWFLYCLVIVLVLQVIQALSSVYQQHLATYLQNNFSQAIRTALVEKSFQLSMSYFNEAKLGEIVHLQTSVLSRCASLIATVQASLSKALSIIPTVVLMVGLSYVLTIATTVGFILIYLLTRHFQKSNLGYSYLASRKSEIVSSLFLEMIGAMRLIKQAGQEAKAKRKYLDASEDAMRAVLKFGDVSALISVFAQVGGMVIVVFLLASTSLLFDTKLLDELGFTIGFFYLCLQGVSALKNFVHNQTRLVTMIPHLEMVGDFLLSKAHFEVRDKHETTVPFPGLTRSVQLEKLTFGYEPSKPVLKDLSLEFPIGTMNGIVGLSGSGKSTMFELLAAFRQPNEGRVLVDGIALPTYTLPSYRRTVAYSSQEATIFNDTVFENIRFIHPKASDDDVVKAARLALAHGFIMDLEKGYDTVIGERGANLSGGQKQRIALARIFLQNSNFIILDEATSAVDLYTEQRIMENLSTLREGRVILIASHRLSIMRQFNSITVLHKGGCFEQGTHGELMTKRGLYNHLYELQEITGDMDFSKFGVTGD